MSDDEAYADKRPQVRTHRKLFSMTTFPKLQRLVDARPAGRNLTAHAREHGPYAAEAHLLREAQQRSPAGLVLPTAVPDVLLPTPTPQASRWVMLLYLSSLALLSDWTCFSAAPIGYLVERNFSLHDSHLVTCFLATNVAFCVLEPHTVRRYGLRRAVVCGAFVMALGCVLRCCAAYVAADAERLFEAQVLVVVGTMLVGAAQPFFQCTPSLLAANWFAESETTLAATLALNANQLGIAASYAVGAGLVHGDEDLRRYFVLMAATSVFLAIGTLNHFRTRPTRPPSYSALALAQRRNVQRDRREVFDLLRQARVKSPEDSASPASEFDGEEDDKFDDPPQNLLLRRWIVNSRRVGHGAVELTVDFWTATQKLRRVRGFDACVVAFVASIIASNIFSTFLPRLIDDSEVHAVSATDNSKQRNAVTHARVASLGAGFQIAIMCGSLAFGAVVDATKWYKQATLAAFAASAVFLAVLSRVSTMRVLLDASILLLGFFVGPIQPLAAELAVEITYPDGDENTIVAIQQTCGNLASALAVPLFLSAQRWAGQRKLDETYGVRLEYALVAGVVAASALFFTTALEAPLKRTAVNERARGNTTPDRRPSVGSKYMTM